MMINCEAFNIMKRLKSTTEKYLRQKVSYLIINDEQLPLDNISADELALCRRKATVIGADRGW
jgi:hypothetical protein